MIILTCSSEVMRRRVVGGPGFLECRCCLLALLQGVNGVLVRLSPATVVISESLSAAPLPVVKLRQNMESDQSKKGVG
ncbi:unnamed protein product [Linum trigynum]|uniref:Uncharacterized protein n=1 Tax=Linum trigynum TaxID=586398 RepID=A0AAV2CY98_9ROSI